MRGVSIDEDAGIGRFYLPIEALQAAGIEPGDLVTRINDEPIANWALGRYEELVRTSPVVDFTLLFGRTETIERVRTFNLVP